MVKKNSKQNIRIIDLQSIQTSLIQLYKKDSSSKLPLKKKSLNSEIGLQDPWWTCSQGLLFGPLFLCDLAQGPAGTLGTWTMCLDKAQTGLVPLHRAL